MLSWVGRFIRVQSCAWHKRPVSARWSAALTVMLVCVQACHPGIASTDIYNKMDTSGKLTAKVRAHCLDRVAALASNAMERGSVLAGHCKDII